MNIRNQITARIREIDSSMHGATPDHQGAHALGYMHGMIDGINRAVVAMQPKDNEQRNAALEQLKRDTLEVAELINECTETAT